MSELAVPSPKSSSSPITRGQGRSSPAPSSPFLGIDAGHSTPSASGTPTLFSYDAAQCCHR
eukprot:2102160-Rhodomonas_salina.2